MYKKCLHTIMSLLLLYCVLNSAFTFKTLHRTVFFFFGEPQLNDLFP